MDWPSALHAAWAKPRFGMPASIVTVSPRRVTLPSSRFVRKPAESLSGCQNTDRAPSVPGTANRLVPVQGLQP